MWRNTKKYLSIMPYHQPGMWLTPNFIWSRTTITSVQQISFRTTIVVKKNKSCKWWFVPTRALISTSPGLSGRQPTFTVDGAVIGRTAVGTCKNPWSFHDLTIWTFLHPLTTSNWRSYTLKSCFYKHVTIKRCQRSCGALLTPLGNSPAKGQPTSILLVSSEFSSCL